MKISWNFHRKWLAISFIITIFNTNIYFKKSFLSSQKPRSVFAWSISKWSDSDLIWSNPGLQIRSGSDHFWKFRIRSDHFLWVFWMIPKFFNLLKILLNFLGFSKKIGQFSLNWYFIHRLIIWIFFNAQWKLTISTIFSLSLYSIAIK